MLVGQTVGKFRIEKKLGEGAMGSVYLARYTGDDSRLLKELGPDAKVALKVIAFCLANNETAIARFEREAKILKQLKHPNIVRLYGTGRYRETPFILMEFIAGQSMDKIMDRRGRFSWEEVVEYGKQLCAALTHAHEKGIIHRDLKPSNLMLTTDGVLKLTDFGIAKDLDGTGITGANNTIGTAAYMSPEQCRGEKFLTAKSDLYSLGVVFYELITGKKPFQAESSMDMFMLHVQGTFVRPSLIVPEIPMWLDTLICQMLEKKPEHRPLDAEMVARALGEVAEKVSSQKSIGAEIANAKVGDRVHLTGMLDETDKEIGKTIKAGMKKKKLKKKTTPIYKQGWFTVIAAVLFVGLFSAFLMYMFKPESPEAMIARINSLKDPAAKSQAMKEYLDRYGNRADDETERIRAEYQTEYAKKWEQVMLKRFLKGMRADANAEPGWDKESHQLLIEVLDAEAGGEIDKAKKLLVSLSGRENEPSLNDPCWNWIGKKKLKDLEEIANLEKRINDLIEKNKDNEVEQRFEDMNEARIAEALRLEKLGDFFTAKDRWEKIKEASGKEMSQRPQFLIATNHLREIAAKIGKMTPEDREKLLLEKIVDGKKNAIGGSTEVAKREGRNLLREISVLYENETEALKKLATQAKEELKNVPR